MLLMLKPLVTAACVASGSPGGLFTPTFAVGVLLAGVGGALWSARLARLGCPAAYALIGGGAFLAAAMQGPLSGIVLVLELTRHFDSLMVPTLVAVVEATVLSRKLRGLLDLLGAARLGRGRCESSPTANAASIATIYALDEALPPTSAAV